MELQQLRYFIGVAENLNFHKAAQELHIAQPGLSRHIRDLEDELGTAVFVRTRRMVALTESGRLLLPHARSLLRNVEYNLRALRPATDATTIDRQMHCQ